MLSSCLSLLTKCMNEAGSGRFSDDLYSTIYRSVYISGEVLQHEDYSYEKCEVVWKTNACKRSITTWRLFIRKMVTGK